MVRVRIAPAPSGTLHIGNVRTALYNWLFARSQGGVFVLRIEDTDQSRVSEESFESVLSELRWLGLDWDEGPEVGGPFGPYRQSERLDTYEQASKKLMDDGRAYRCYCTPEELKVRREQAQAEKRRPGYDGRCRLLTAKQISDNENEGRRWVLRFYVSDDGETTFDDLITGPVTWRHEEIDDFAILRQDGYPVYNFGVAIDDALMKMTHVIRGMDIQSSTPRQIMILKVLGYDPPRYGHIPLVMGPGGQKLSKRYGGGSVQWYRDHGFLPEALINGLALLGTGFGDETILSQTDMVKKFDLSHVHASPAVFDLDKLDWMNGEYIRGLSDDKFEERAWPWLKELADYPPSPEQADRVHAAAPLLKARIKRLDQAVSYLRPVLSGVELDAEAVTKGLRQDHVPDLLRKSIAALEKLASWNKESVEATLRTIQQEMDLKPKTAFLPFFVAITGSTVGLPIFDVMAIIGKQISLERLQHGLSIAMAAGEGLEPSTF